MTADPSPALSPATTSPGTGRRVVDVRAFLRRWAVFGHRFLIRRRLTTTAYFHSLFERDQRAIDDTNRFYETLAGAPLRGESAIDFIREHTYDSDYLEYHARRFTEQLALFSHLCDRMPVSRVLDIGTMPYTTSVMKYYRPDLELVTVDLPPELGGPEIARFDELGVERHVAVDLDAVDLTELAGDVSAGGRFDVVFACEVVEHLRLDFSEIVEFCLSVIRPGGLVVVTTPNFLSAWKLETIMTGVNPQGRFHHYRDVAGGYHYREYTMKELATNVRDHGGSVVAEVYSDALDAAGPDPTGEGNYMFRENMVFVFSDQEVSVW